MKIQTSIQNTVDRLSSMAIQEAIPYVLDYSEKSVGELEKALERHYCLLNNAQDKEEEVWQLTSMYGAYLGKLLWHRILKDYGFEWKLSTEGLLVLKSDKREFSPLAKVYKRLLNGKNENIIDFFQGVILVMNEY
ncbi:hypothetical protein CCZ01_08205 [Helicobacter monodelphidis]|uniref:hypothetical protein n=1 Tax=Helicobacter sp. 15-1451 TaxID=2004995 RepID=UPI000DCE9E92|nr:hypothetical protein [Helicobacter sp. 15-1451]RAX56830.1 hypothetical protein CCZ01_08205 [Helicobacter sp. 15-1451]